LPIPDFINRLREGSTLCGRPHQGITDGNGSFLVGGFNPSEKYESNRIISPGRGENKKKLKPPARFVSFSPWVPHVDWRINLPVVKGSIYKDLERRERWGFHEVKRHKRVSFLPWTFYIIDLKVVVVFVLGKSNIETENDGFFDMSFWVSILVFGGLQIHTKCQPLVIPNSLDHMTWQRLASKKGSSLIAWIDTSLHIHVKYVTNLKNIKKCHVVCSFIIPPYSS